MGLRDKKTGNDQDEPAGNTVPVSKALQLLASGGAVIDVRPVGEYERGHIPGSRPVTIEALQEAPLEAIWGADPLAMMDPATLEKAVIVVSITQAHGDAIAHLLRDAGLIAYSIEDGLLGWIHDGQILLPGPPR